MATADMIKALVRAHTDRDYARFKAITLQIAAHAEKSSPVFAKSLRELADRIEERPHTMTALPTNMLGHFAQKTSTTKLSDMVLEPRVRERIDRVLMENAKRDTLADHGLRPMRKLLFVGPPGVGKTMMASALAFELKLPVLRVQLHTTIASHLGETAAHLGKIFDNIKVFRGVYLFDEIDALAPERAGGNSTDVGEMKRVANSMLQFIEDDTSDSIIIGATNHADLLDRALFRRFDEVISFPLPTVEVAEQLMRERLLFGQGIDWSCVRGKIEGVGHADLVAACQRVNKDAVIGDRTSIRTDELTAAISAYAR